MVKAGIDDVRVTRETLHDVHGVGEMKGASGERCTV